MTGDTKNIRKRLELLENAIASLTAGEGSPDNVDDQRCGFRDIGQPLAEQDQASQAGIGRVAPVVPSPQYGEGDILHVVEAVIASRRQRLKFFEPDLFFDPSWTMLLDLFRAALRRQRISVSSVCYGSGVPETTALRYIKVMEERGYLTRDPDPTDKRRVFLCLTPLASERLTGYFMQVASDLAFTGQRAGRMASARAMRQ
jgi:hypothetical protein